MRKSTVDLMLIAVVVIWGANYTIGKFGMQALSPDVFTLTRFLMVIPILLLLVKWKEGGIAIRKRDIPAFLVAALVGIALYQTLFVASLKYTTATNASLLVAMSPIFTVFIALMTKQERFTPMLGIGSLLAVTGVFVIKGMGESGLSFTLDSLKGDLIALIASILFGLYPFTTARLAKTYSAMKITLHTAVFGSLFLALYCGHEFLMVEWGSIPLSAWGSLLYSAIPTTAYSLAAWNYGMEVLGPSRVMPYMYLVPVAAILVAMMWIGERMSGWQWLGAVMILGGVFLVRQGGALWQWFRTTRKMGQKEQTY
jgi:drug/metabolite transporter (DMT)-like permease